MVALVGSVCRNVNHTVSNTLNNPDALARVVTKVAVPTFAALSAYALFFGASFAFTATALTGLLAFYTLQRAINDPKREQQVDTKVENQVNPLLENELNEAKANVVRLERLLAQEQARYENLAETETKSSALKDQEIASLNDQLEAARLTAHQKEKEFASLKDQLEAARLATRQSEEEFASLKEAHEKSVRTSEAAQESLQGQLNEKAKEYQTLLEDSNALRNQLEVAARVQDELEVFKANEQDYKQKLSDALEAKNAAEALSSTTQEEVDSLKNRLVESEQQKSDALVALQEEHNLHVAELEKEIARLKEYIEEDHRNDVAEDKKDLEDARAKVAEYEKRLAEHEGDKKSRRRHKSKRKD